MLQSELELYELIHSRCKTEALAKEYTRVTLEVFGLLKDQMFQGIQAIMGRNMGEISRVVHLYFVCTHGDHKFYGLLNFTSPFSEMHGDIRKDGVSVALINWKGKEVKITNKMLDFLLNPKSKGAI